MPISSRARRASLVLVPVALLGLAGCATDSPAATPSSSSSSSPTPHGAAWSYEGATAPGHWASLSDAYRTCGTGTEQSPIDLPEPAHGAALEVSSEPVRGDTADNGHTVQFTADDGAVTTIDGEELTLVQMHFHAGSEHTVRGERSDAEFHFVHADADGSLTVVGVLAEAGEHNPAFDSYLDGVDSETGKAGTVDVGSMLPAERSYWTYTGSLTTPPCTEGVRWIVLEDPIELDEDQIDALDEAHDHNDRPVQPLGDRTVAHDLS